MAVDIVNQLVTYSRFLVADTLLYEICKLIHWSTDMYGRRTHYNFGCLLNVHGSFNENFMKTFVNTVDVN